MAKQRKSLADFYETSIRETTEAMDRLRAYYEALGRFIDRFAVAETTVEYVLRHYAKMSPSVAIAILSGVRADTACGFIRKLTDGLAEPGKGELHGLLDQFGSINGARNNIVHYGASAVAEGAGYVTNALKRASGKATVFDVSPDTLDQMSEDLRKIIVLLLLDHAGRPPLGVATRKLILGSLQGPWLYKHAERPLR